VLRWYERDQRDTDAVTAVLWGSRQHTAIEQAVGTRAGKDDWTGQLAEALGAFTRTAWPRKLLTRSTAHTPAGRRNTDHE
jgi:hypothetical protein